MGDSHDQVPDFYAGQRPAQEYEYEEAIPPHHHDYLAPALVKLLGDGRARSLLDLGCGNGSLTALLAEAGFVTTGAEASESGIALARDAYPDLNWADQDVNEPLAEDLRGAFDLVLAAEVIEHLFLPRALYHRASEALKPGGQLIITTPFHGYWKNLALAATNKFDFHMRPGWDYGHIKFFSVKTLTQLTREMNFEPKRWEFVGRVPALAKSMIVIAEKS